LKIRLNNPQFTLEDYDIGFLKNVNENNNQDIKDMFVIIHQYWNIKNQ